MTDADTTRTQTTTYIVQFKGNVSGKWVEAAHEPFNHLRNAQAWTDERIPEHVSRIIKRTITDEVVSEREEVA